MIVLTGLNNYHYYISIVVKQTLNIGHQAPWISTVLEPFMAYDLLFSYRMLVRCLAVTEEAGVRPTELSI